MLHEEERRAIEATLRRFGARIDEVMFGAPSQAGETADGDLSRLPGLLAEAREMDLLADAAPGAPGHELGVWGAHCRDEGPALSLLTLSLLGKACAGIATAVHAQGLACLALPPQGAAQAGEEVAFPPGALLAAAMTPEYGIPLRPEGSGLEARDGGQTLSLHGTSHFLLAAGEPQGLVCFARAASPAGEPAEWVSLALDADAPGVALTEVTHRTGLRAARQYHLRCEGVEIPADRVLHRGEAARRSLQQVVACDWLGQAAIALGVARRALRDSRQYTAQRYQGGRLIEEHASIRLLQGSAEYDIGLLAAIVDRHTGAPLASLAPEELLCWAIQARLAVAEHAHRAVTHCLQTLGGYGYMADYGFEKRLRDVSTLKSLHGAPDQLRLFLNELAVSTGER